MIVLAPYFASFINANKEPNEVFQSAAWCTFGGSFKVFILDQILCSRSLFSFTCGLVQVTFQMNLETFLIRSGKIGRSSESSLNFQQPAPLSWYICTDRWFGCEFFNAYCRFAG